MATVGNTATPSFGNQWVGINVNNQVASSFTMPSPGGTITGLHAFWDAESSSGTGYVCLWDASGNLLASASVGTVPTGPNTFGGQAWHTATLSSGVFIASGATIQIGFWQTNSDGATWSFNNSGSSVYNRQSSAPGSLAGAASTGNGSIGAYADYTPGGAAYVNTGLPGAPVWTQGLVYVNTGTPASPVWTQATAYINTGTSGSPVWTPGS